MNLIRRWPILLVYLYFTLSVLIGFLAFERKISTFKPLGFYFRGTPPTVTQIEAGSNSELAGLKPGDVILAVNDEPVTESTLREILQDHAQGSTLNLRRDGEKLSIFLQLPPGEVDLAYLLFSFTGFVFLIIGTFCFVRKRMRASLIFFWITLMAFQILVLQPAGKLNDLWRSIMGFQFLATLLLPTTLFHFTLIFPRNLVKGIQRLIPVLYLPSLAHFVVTMDLLFLNRFFSLGEEAIYTLNGLRTLWIILMILSSLVTFSVQWFTVRTSVQRRQLQWIFLGLALGFLPFLLFYVVPMETGLHLGVSPLIFIPLLTFIPLSTTYAIWEYKIWDVSLVIREVLSYAITIALGFIVYFFIYHLLSIFPEASVTSRYFVLFAAGFVIAIYFFPIHRSIEELLTRIQYGAQFQKRQELLDFSQKIPQFTSLADLLDAFGNQLKSTLQVSSCNYYIRRKNQFHRLEDDQILPPILTPEEVKDWTPDRHYSIVFPVRFQNQLLALLVVGNRENGDPLSTEERTILLNLCSQLGLMIHNLILIEDMKEKMDQLAYLHRFNETILQRSPVGIAVTDAAGTLLTLNDSGRAVLGAMKSFPTLPESFLESDLETRILEYEGKTLLIFTAPMEVGDATFQLTIFNDISENISLRQELARQEHLAILGQVSASVAHEINTPLTGISSFAQILQGGLDSSDRLYRYASHITRETFYLSNLVGTLLKFARSGEQETARCAIGERIKEAIDLVQPMLETHEFSIDVELPEDNCEVTINETLFTQALVNLIVNACQAVQWKGHVTVRARSDRDRVFVEVEDDGPGVPPAIRESLGRPFVSSGKKGSGTGLGLALSHAIIDSYGGTITVECPEKGGTIFILELSCAKDDSDRR
ncbi:MAG TPA: ATP-binding protein [Thermoanaerobaculia bacterium]|nr:ATP-binding protein [Thermoanaerobaculia bacterium]HUM28784.1 ATP-binding protein [Thermoanaerobaculia bacterium]HXK67966.1 ATP-binding protein [Thermoanaerobaculia bacterium]